MAYTARGLVDQARSLAVLQATKFISYTDQLFFINQAYRDIYSRYTESDGDYYVTDYVFNLTGAMLDPTDINGTNFLVPLPADFLKIRYLDYNTGGYWYPVDVFNTAQKDNVFSTPRYRLKNNRLWLIVSPGVANQFRLGYYPIASTVTLPDEPIPYGAAIAAYNLPLVTYPCFVPSGRTMLYVYNGTTIYAESKDNNSTTSLYSAGGAKTWLTYYKGYVYWIEGGNVLRAPTDLSTAPLVPATIVNTANVQNLSIVNDKIYFYNGTNTLEANLDGSGSSTFKAFFTKNVCKVGAFFAYLDNSNALFVNDVSVQTGVTSVVTDSVYLYIVDTLFNFSQLTISSAGAITAATVLLSDTSAVFNLSAGFAAITVNSTSAFIAVSAVANTSFDFPTNEVNEILAYACAILFAQKENDGERAASLAGQLEKLWERFWAVNKRDEYEFTRVNDAYREAAGWLD